jgi:hypothetical protein
MPSKNSLGLDLESNPALGQKSHSGILLYFRKYKNSSIILHAKAQIPRLHIFSSDHEACPDRMLDQVNEGVAHGEEVSLISAHNLN